MEALNALRVQASSCTACALHKTRIQPVFSDGNPHASLVIIGEAPGQQEDEAGLPFVGRSGQLLTQLLADAGICRQQETYICNVLKCRPPDNRPPLPAEIAACNGYLVGQLQAIQPAFLLLVGATALKAVLGPKVGTISRIRGQWFDTALPGNPRAMPVFHPAYLLRNRSEQPGSPLWLMRQDLAAVRQALGRQSLDGL